MTHFRCISKSIERSDMHYSNTDGIDLPLNRVCLLLSFKDALQQRMRANDSLDYALCRLSDAFINFGFLGSHIFLVL